MLFEDEHFSDGARRAALIFVLVIALLTGLDVWEDAREGSTLLHMTMEGIIVSCCLVVAGLLWRKSIRHASTRNRELSKALHLAQLDLDHWRSQTLSLSKSLRNAIVDQLNKWGLTDAEQNVAFNLLRGLSIKEIAVERDTSERTVRQQTAAIYQKSNLDGRAQFAAFFLENILADPQKNVDS